MSIQSVESIACRSWRGKQLQVDAVEEKLTSDAGLIIFGQLDEEIAWTKHFSHLITETRTRPTHTRHAIVRQRVFGIIAGYEDQNDHDTLRSDPIFKLIADYDLDDGDLASQPTISRLENSVTAADLLRMEDWFIERFIESFDEPPQTITLDIDTSDDPSHGQQQLTFFHGFYQQHQYLLRFITCDENDMVVLPVLLFGNAVAKIGAADDLKRVILRLRQRFPNVQVHVRADSAFGGPFEYATLESIPDVTYCFGMKANRKSMRLTEDLLETAIQQAKETGEPQLHYQSLPDYKAKMWKTSKTVVAKAEVTAHMQSRRFVITNSAPAITDPKGTYEAYAQRGESENRNKELKCDLMVDRLSDHRYMANLFRVMLHSLAHNLIVTMRSRMQPASDTAIAETVCCSDTGQSSTGSKSGPARRTHNERRRRNVLGEAHPCTWRMLVIKVAARVVVSARRIRIMISKSWPHVRHLRHAFSGL